MLALHSPHLAFSRDGRSLVRVGADRIDVVDASTGATTPLAIAEAHAVVGFVDEIWVACAAGLRRVGRAGRALGVIGLPAAPAAMLLAAPVGPAAAVWTATPAVVVLEDRGEVQAVPAPVGCELAIPLTGRRWVTTSGARMVAPSGLSCELAPGSRVLGGTVVLNGSAAVLVVERPNVRELVVVGLANGRPQLRQQVPATTLRAAVRRGLIAIRVDARRVAILDLRSGRAIGEVASDGELVDFALDPDGQRIALRGDGTALEVMWLRDALAAATTMGRGGARATVDGEAASGGAASDEGAAAGRGAAAGSGEAAAGSGEAAGASGVAAAAGGEAAAAGGEAAAAAVAASGVAAGAGGVAAAAGGVAAAAGVAAGGAAAAAAASAAVVIMRPLELRALSPAVQVSPVPRADALAYLDHETRTIGLLTLQAIAAAWDSRRIGYGNEGRHPYEHEVAALLGMNDGFATEHVAAAVEHLAQHEAALAAMPERRSLATPLGALSAELGLSALAIDILLTVAAPALWSEAARLYGILANDPNRGLVDEALVEQILSGRATRHELAAELDARAPLIQLGVIAVDPGRARPFAPLAVDPIVIARLRREAPDLGPGLAARGSDRALEELTLGPDVIGDALAALGRAPAPARIALRGRPGSGRRTLMAALAAEAGRALGVIDLALLPRTAQGQVGQARALRAGLRRAQLAGLLPCVVGLEELAFGEREGRDAAVDVLRSHPGPLGVILPAAASAPLDPGHVAIELPLLDEGARLAMWRTALGDAGLRVAAPAALAARYRIGPGVVHRAVAATVERGRGQTQASDATPELERFIRQARDGRLGAHARRVERLARWDGLVLPGDVLDSLRELVARVRHRRTVFETWGMDETMATSRGLTALFSGPPGTGKTLVAGVIARELGLDLYQVDLSKMVSKWIGETERNLGAIFDAAEDGQVILLFDEADSLFAKRTEVRSSNDRYANLEVNYLLQRLDSFEGIAILTTNASGSIDPAFKRRLSFRLSFPFPDEDTREQLWRAHLPAKLPIGGVLALDKLAHKYQLSGGYIRNACLRAAFLAAQDQAALTQHHLERAVALEFAELGKLSSGGALD